MESILKKMKTTKTVLIIKLHLHIFIVSQLAPHHVPNDVVVCALGAVDSQYSKNHKHHGTSVNQRTDCWLATATSTTGVKTGGPGPFR
jgi:hypothetical protein